MALEYFLYRTDINNTLVDRGATSFAPLPPNTGEILIDFPIPTNQPLYFYRESGSTIILNSDNNIETYLSETEVVSDETVVTVQDLINYVSGATTLGGNTIFVDKVGQNLRFKGLVAGNNISLVSSANTLTISSTGGGGVSEETFTGYTATTETRLDGIDDDITYLSGQTNLKLNELEFNSYTATTETRLDGIEADITYLSGQTASKVSNIKFNTYTGTTETRLDGIENDVVYLSAQTASKVSSGLFNTYTGTTAPATYASKSAFLTFTGTTAPATYQSKSSINTYTGTTAPNQFAAKSAFLTYTGTTAPATYALKSNFNSYTATTDAFLDSISGASIGETITMYPVHADATAAITLTNQPAAAQFLANSNRNIFKLNLTNASQIKLITRVVTASASAASPRIILRYRTAFSTTVTDYIDIGVGATPVQTSLSATGLIDSGWVNVTALAKAEVFLTVVQIGGDGTADPSLGLISILVKNVVSTADSISEALFTGYTATTETRLQGIEDDITYLSGQTASKVSNSKFNTYTGTTETRLDGIEDDINYLSGQTANKLNISTFNSYTDATDPILDGAITGITVGVNLSAVQTGRVVDIQFTGSTGGASAQLLYRFDTTTSGAGISSGDFRLNNVNSSLATAMYFNYENDSGVDVSPLLLALDSGAKIYILSTDNADESALYSVVSVQDNATYVTITVVNESTGSDTSLTNNDVFGIIINQASTSGIYVTQSTFNTYTGTTETRLDGIEDDVVYLSGETTSKVSNSKFNTYTGTTAPNQFAAKSAFLTYTGTTAPVTYQSKSSIATYTGTTAPNQFAAKSAFLTFTGTTAPATYQSKISINTYTGTTAPNQFAAKTNFNTFTGTTAPATYQSKSSIVTLTGTTLPNTYASKSAFLTFTGTTAPATYALKSIFNSYTGTTNTAINNRLLISTFNSYTATTTGVLTANNGLTKNGTNVRLGGSLTGATTITSPATGSRLSFAGFPIQYSTDLSGSYNIRSLVDRGYVTGITSTLVTQAKINTYTGTTAPATYQSKSSINTYTGTTAPNQFAAKSAFLTYTGTTAPNQFAAKTNFNTFTGTTAPVTYLAKSIFNTYTGGTTNVTAANNGLNKIGNNVRLGGTLTGATTITSPATGSRLSFAGFPIQYSTDVSANYNPRSLVDKAYVTGLTSSNVYGTQYQLASALASTSTSSTTGVTKVLMTTTNLPSGTYRITVGWLWSRDTVSNSARFDVTINGTTQGTRGTIEIEAGDTTDIIPETRVFYVALSGVNTIRFRHWGESGANSTTTSDATIELIRVA